MADPVFLGLDVARDDLEVAVYPTGAGWRVPNTPAGHARRGAVGADPPPSPPGAGSHRRLRARRGCGVACRRAAGGRQQPAPGARLRPQPHILAKTDHVDAQVLARFAAEVQPPLRPRPSAASQELHALVTRRRQLLTSRVAEQQRRPLASPVVRADIDANLAWSSAWPPSTLRSPRPSRPMRPCAPARPGSRASPASALRPAPPCWPSSPNSAASHAARLPPWSGSPPSTRQRHLARPPQYLGRARLSPRRPLYGHRRRHPRQSGHPRVLSAPGRGRQAAPRWR